MPWFQVNILGTFCQRAYKIQCAHVSEEQREYQIMLYDVVSNGLVGVYSPSLFPVLVLIGIVLLYYNPLLHTMFWELCK